MFQKSGGCAEAANLDFFVFSLKWPLCRKNSKIPGLTAQGALLLLSRVPVGASMAGSFLVCPGLGSFLVLGLIILKLLSLKKIC